MEIYYVNIRLNQVFIRTDLRISPPPNYQAVILRTYPGIQLENVQLIELCWQCYFSTLPIIFTHHFH
jgi:hypothetical protein